MSNKCVFYLRYSSAGQSEQSIEGQERVCSEYCKHNDLLCVDRYIDRALSGTTDNRAAFQQLIKDSKKHEWDYVIVYKLDRFARNRYDSAMYKRVLKQNGVKVVSAMECISDTPEGVILESVIEGFAEYYSLNLSQNVLRGLRESASKGQCLGGHPPFGYSFENKKVFINEPEARILKKVFEGIASGRAQSDICKELNDSGYRRRNGQPFTKDSFYTALRNRKYIGEFVYNGELTDIYPPILSVDLFECVQKIIGAKSHVRKETVNTKDFLLRGKLFCGECDKRLETTVCVCDCGTSKNGTVHRYYSCAVHKKHPKDCTKQSEPVKLIEDFVVDQTIDFLSDDDVMSAVKEQVKSEYLQRYNLSELGEIKREIAQTQSSYDKTFEKYIAETNPRLCDKLKEKMQYLDDHLSILEKERTTMERSLKIDESGDKYAAVVKALTDGDRDDPSFRRRLIDTFVSKVYAYNNKYVVFYNVTGYSEDDEAKIKSLEQDDCSKLYIDGRAFTTLFEHLVSFTPYGVYVVFNKS